MDAQHKRPVKKPETISADLLKVLQDAMGDLNRAQLQRDAIVAAIVRHYKLRNDDSVELTTGVITRKQVK